MAAAEGGFVLLSDDEVLIVLPEQITTRKHGKMMPEVFKRFLQT